MNRKVGFLADIFVILKGDCKMNMTEERWLEVIRDFGGKNWFFDWESRRVLGTWRILVKNVSDCLENISIQHGSEYI